MKRIVRREQIPVLFFVLLLYIPAINYFIADILVNDLGMSSLTVPFYLILSLVGVYSFKYLPKTSNVVVVLVALLFLSTIIASIIYPEITTFLISKDYNPQTSDAIMLLLYSVPAMILGGYLSINNGWSNVAYFLKPASLFLTVIGIFSYVYTVLINGHYLEYEYMSFSYFMLPGVVYSIIIGASEKRYIYLLVGSIGFIIIMVGGARGALACAVLTFLISIFLHGKLKKLIVTFIALGIALYFVINSFDALSDLVQTYMAEHDAYSRNLSRLEEGTMTKSAGREVISNYINDAIRENPFGYGLFGDRHVLIPKSYLYAHSIILEFIIDFGIFLGPLFLMLIVVRTVKHLLKSSHEEASIILVIISSGLMKLFFSGTYLTEIFFWALIGIIADNKKMKRVHTSNTTTPKE